MEALARGNAQVDYKNAFLEVNVMWCDVIYFSTRLKQGRLEVWHSFVIMLCGGGFASRETAPASFEVLCAGEGSGGKTDADGIRLPWEELGLQ